VTAEDTHLTYREAIKTAIQEAMRRDERVFLMGEDVGMYGGCYAVSKGSLAEFGPEPSVTLRSPSRRSSARGSGPRSPACGRSSRS
jgi:2-oxoisovalerate dehydrogenase E1 component